MGDLAAPLATKVGPYAAKKTLKPLVKLALGTFGENGTNPLLELLKSNDERILEVLQLRAGSKIDEADQLLADIALRESQNDLNSEDTSKLEQAAAKYQKALSQQPTLEQWITASAGYLLCRERIYLRKKVRLLSRYLNRWEQDLKFIVNKGECLLSKAVNEKYLKIGLVQLFKEIYANAKDAAEHLDAECPDLCLCELVVFLRTQIVLPKSDRSRFQRLLDVAEIPTTFELISLCNEKVNKRENRAVGAVASVTQPGPQPEGNERQQQATSSPENQENLPNTRITILVTDEEFSKRLGRAPGVLSSAHKSVFEALLANFAYLNAELQPYIHALDSIGPGMAAIKFIPFLQSRIRYGSKDDNIPFVFATTLRDMGDYAFWLYLCGHTKTVPDTYVLRKLGKKIPPELWNNYLELDPDHMFPQLMFMENFLWEAKTCNRGPKYQMYLIYVAYQSNPEMKGWSQLCAAMAKNPIDATKVIEFFKSQFTSL